MISKSEDIYDINFSYSQIGDSKSIYIKYKHKINSKFRSIQIEKQSYKKKDEQKFDIIVFNEGNFTEIELITLLTFILKNK